MITLDDVIAGFTYAGAAFPNYQVTREQVQVYFECLEDLNIGRDELINAFREAVKESEFFPTIASIRAQFKQTPTPPKFETPALAAPQAHTPQEWAKIARETLLGLSKQGQGDNFSDFGKLP